ncbi:Uncharacterised protein [uncultured archaeon]|nr:Uncharacterised protein [uncultured archaeon]
MAGILTSEFPLPHTGAIYECVCRHAQLLGVSYDKQRFIDAGNWHAQYDDALNSVYGCGTFSVAYDNAELEARTELCGALVVNTDGALDNFIYDMSKCVGGVEELEKFWLSELRDAFAQRLDKLMPAKRSNDTKPQPTVAPSVSPWASVAISQ